MQREVAAAQWIQCYILESIIHKSRRVRVGLVGLVAAGTSAASPSSRPLHAWLTVVCREYHSRFACVSKHVARSNEGDKRAERKREREKKGRYGKRDENRASISLTQKKTYLNVSHVFFLQTPSSPSHGDMMMLLCILRRVRFDICIHHIVDQTLRDFLQHLSRKRLWRL